MEFKNKHANKVSNPNFKNKANLLNKKSKAVTKLLKGNSNIRKKIIFYKNNKLIISPLNIGLKIKWIKKLPYFKFKQKMAILKKTSNFSKFSVSDKIKNDFRNFNKNKNKKQIILIPFSKLFTSLRNIKLSFIRYYKFQLQQNIFPKIMTKNHRFIKGIKILNSYDHNLIKINNLNTIQGKKESLNGTLIEKLKLNSISSLNKSLTNYPNIKGKLTNLSNNNVGLNKDNFKNNYSPIINSNLKSIIKDGGTFSNLQNNDLLYNLASLKQIKTQKSIESSDYSVRNLYLSQKLDLANSASQSKDMRENLVSKVNLISKYLHGNMGSSYVNNSKFGNSIGSGNFININKFQLNLHNKNENKGNTVKNDLNFVSSKNLLTSIYFDTKSKKALKNIELSKNLNSNRELPLQPNIKMAYYNYITYPYKKRVQNPSILSYYSTWKSGNSVYTILNSAFERMSCLISKPYFYETPNRLTIQLFYYSKNRGKKPRKLLVSSDNSEDMNSNWISIQKQNGKNLKNFVNVTQYDVKPNLSFESSAVNSMPIDKSNKVSVNTWHAMQANKFKNSKVFLIKNQNKFNNLCLLLSKLFNKQVVLDITRIKRPYYDVTILNQIFHKNSQERNSRFVKLISLLLYTLSRKYKWLSSALENKNKFNPLKNNDALRGFKIKLGGRLLSQKIIPRISTKTYNRGKIARGKVHFVNTSRIINKHKRGAYSITITTSSVIF
jgi:hypothetical protein